MVKIFKILIEFKNKKDVQKYVQVNIPQEYPWHTIGIHTVGIQKETESYIRVLCDLQIRTILAESRFLEASLVRETDAKLRNIFFASLP